MNVGAVKDYYALLGVDTSALTSEIHKAYWRKASQYHPDKGGNHEMMVQITEAWSILSDPSKRARYNQMRDPLQRRWNSKKFDEDVLAARNKADTYARSWAEFENVYQKAFYTFNQDFYGKDFDIKASGPYSPLMNSTAENTLTNKVTNNDLKEHRSAIVGYVFKAIIIILVFVSVFFWQRNNAGNGRYVPLGHKEPYPMIMDTSSGAVYILEKNAEGISSWKETTRPLSSGHK
ncbi:MAG: J domain-containing protein [Desulfuromonadaceae bacterium]|nr:J domain-containing protein [Desulfuromonadaceae bacterium]